jgi:hypothetical protein
MTPYLLPEVCFTIFLIIVAAYGIHHSKSKFRPRYDFPSSVQRQTLHCQKYRCAICKQQLKKGKFEFHHKDRNRCNNKLKNCQALCKTCHKSITAKDYKSYRNRTNWASLRWTALSSTILLLFLTLLSRSST